MPLSGALAPLHIYLPGPIIQPPSLHCGLYLWVLQAADLLEESCQGVGLDIFALAYPTRLGGDNVQHAALMGARKVEPGHILFRRYSSSVILICLFHVFAPSIVFRISLPNFMNVRSTLPFHLSGVATTRSDAGRIAFATSRDDISS